MNGYSLLENNSDLIRELVEQKFDDKLFRCIGYGPVLRKILFWRAQYHSYAVGHGIHGNQETEDRFREGRDLFHEQYNSNVVNHRSQEGLLLHFEQQCSKNFLAPVDFKHCSISRSLRHLSSTLTERCNSEDVSLSVCGRACQDVGVVICD